MKKQYSMIDILKVFFAICVVGIHTEILQNPDSKFQWILFHGVFRLAVPFFFVCSGFFLGLKIYKNNDTKTGMIEIKKYIKRLFIPFTFWIIVGLPHEIHELSNDNNFFIIFLKLIRKIVFYPWGALWYILAVIIALIIIIPFYKRNKIEYCIIIGGLLYCFALLCNNYYFLIEKSFLGRVIDLYLKVFISARNGVFVGLLFVSIGIYIAKIQLFKEENHIKKHTILFIVSYVLLIMEIILIRDYSHKDDHSLFIALTVLIPELLILATKIKTNNNTKLLRNYSSGLYFIHRPVINLYTEVLNATMNMNSYILFGIVLTTSIIVLTICYKIDNKYLNKVIK